jgi:hypothetical protein
MNLLREVSLTRLHGLLRLKQGLLQVRAACKKGTPCGKVCIAAGKTCKKGGAAAVVAPEKTAAKAKASKLTAPQDASPPVVAKNRLSAEVEIHGVGARTATARRSEGHKIAVTNQAFRDAWAANTEYHVKAEGEKNAIGGRIKNFEAFLNGKGNGGTGKTTFEASKVHVDKDGEINFEDGRHRFAFMAGTGMKDIPVSMDAESRRNALKHGYLVDAPTAAKSEKKKRLLELHLHLLMTWASGVMLAKRS